MIGQSRRSPSFLSERIGLSHPSPSLPSFPKLIGPPHRSPSLRPLLLRSLCCSTDLWCSPRLHILLRCSPTQPEAQGQGVLTTGSPHFGCSSLRSVMLGETLSVAFPGFSYWLGWKPSPSPNSQAPPSSCVGVTGGGTCSLWPWSHLGSRLAL